MLGAALGIGGALLGGMGGSSGQQSSSTSLPSWMMPYMTGANGILPEARDLYMTGGPDYFQGDTVQDLTPEQLQALEMTRGIAGSSMLPGQAADLNSRTMGGDFLGGGQFMNAYGNDIMDSVASRFGSSGRSGSAMEAKAMANELGSVASRLYGDERNRMQSAMQMSSGIEAGRYAPADRLMGVGSVLQNQGQTELNADIDRWNFEQNQPYDALDRYSSLVYGASPGTTTTTDVNRNPWAGALGGAMTGVSMGGTMGLWG